MTSRAIFLDRDGVLNEVVPDPRTGTCESPSTPEAVRLVPGAAEAVRSLAGAGYRLVVVSNQPGAAKGTTTRETLEAIHDAVESALEGAGARVDAWRYCFHAAADECDCRKPQPGLIVGAAEDLGIDLTASWMIGDSDTDVEAGKRAGCRTALVANPLSAHRRRNGSPDLVTTTLAEATRIILGGVNDAEGTAQRSPAATDLRTKIFADGADLETILRLAENPRLRGFTTNPTLMWKAGLTDYAEFAQRLLERITDRPISFEVFADDEPEMRRQAQRIASWAENVYVKIPVSTTTGEPTAPLVRELSHDGVKVNVTAVMTPRQVEAIATAVDGGAPSIVSVFAGRIADTGIEPVPIMRDCLAILEPVPTAELLWASPRELLNVVQASEIGCHIITVTNDLLAKLDLLGRDLDRFSLETVQMFHRDAVSAGFTL